MPYIHIRMLNLAFGACSNGRCLKKGNLDIARTLDLCTWSEIVRMHGFLILFAMCRGIYPNPIELCSPLECRKS